MIDLVMETVTAVTAGGITPEAINATEGGIVTSLSDFFADFDGIKNFILSLSGVSLLAILYKVRGLLNIIKQPGFEKQAFDLGQKFLADYTQKPELVNELVSTLSNIPKLQELAKEATDTKEKLVLELEGRVFDIEAKIKSGLFTDDELARLVEYKAKLIDHVENVK